MILSLANAYSFHTESTRARLENLCVNQDFKHNSPGSQSNHQEILSLFGNAEGNKN